MALKKYSLMDRRIVEQERERESEGSSTVGSSQAKQLAAEWLLPAGWAVKRGKDGRLIKAS